MMCINDLIDNINADLDKIFKIEYADDAVVFAKSKETLQSLLNDIELYCGTWGLKINIKKTSHDFRKGTSH